MPPTDDESKKSYRADLERFTLLTQRHKVDWISEGRTKTVQRIQEWKRKYDIQSDPAEEAVTIKLNIDDPTWCGDGAKEIDDPSSPTGKCIRLPIQGEAKSVQCFFGSALLNNTDYTVRVQIRSEKVKPDGPAVACGIYSYETEKTPFEITIDASDISDTEYKWIDCGTVNGSDTISSYFYFGQIRDSSVKYIYISAAEITPK